MTMPDPELYVSREQYVDFPEPQVPTPVRARSIARAGHPIIARTPQMWAPLRVDYEVASEPTEKELLDQLRPEAVGLGLNVDGRWSAARLRKEIDKVKAAEAEAGG
jgi:hypothetical protein